MRPETSPGHFEAVQYAGYNCIYQERDTSPSPHRCLSVLWRVFPQLSLRRYRTSIPAGHILAQACCSLVGELKSWTTGQLCSAVFIRSWGTTLCSNGTLRWWYTTSPRHQLTVRLTKEAWKDFGLCYRHISSHYSQASVFYSLCSLALSLLCAAHCVLDPFLCRRCCLSWPVHIFCNLPKLVPSLLAVTETKQLGEGRVHCGRKGPGA